MPQPIIVFSIRNLSFKLERDPRTVASRIEKLGIEAFAVTVDGTALYLESALHRLMASEVEEQAPSPSATEAIAS